MGQYGEWRGCQWAMSLITDIKYGPGDGDNQWHRKYVSGIMVFTPWWHIDPCPHCQLAQVNLCSKFQNPNLLKRENWNNGVWKLDLNQLVSYCLVGEIQYWTISTINKRFSRNIKMYLQFTIIYFSFYWRPRSWKSWRLDHSSFMAGQFHSCKRTILMEQVAITLCKWLKLCKSWANNGDTEITIEIQTPMDRKRNRIKLDFVFIEH